MRIVILDSETFGADIDLSVFQQLGETTIFERTSPVDTIKRITQAEIIITNKVVVGKKEMENSPNLKLICVAATGYNNIDIEAAKEHNIIVTNVRNYSTEAVAQHTFGLILTLQNSILNYVEETRNDNWSKSSMFCMLNHPFYELSGKTIGIIGFGAIGKKVTEIAKAFGMKVLIGKRPNIEYNDTERVSIDKLLSESDIVSIHTPLSENTKNLINIESIKKMKPSALLINVARGGIVNEDDLHFALQSNLIRGAATDVMATEPIEPKHKLITLKNLIITPHMAWASLESRQRLIKGIVSNIECFMEGKGESINLAKC